MSDQKKLELLQQKRQQKQTPKQKPTSSQVPKKGTSGNKPTRKR